MIPLKRRRSPDHGSCSLVKLALRVAIPVVAIAVLLGIEEGATRVSAQSRELPILLVHGFCSSSDTFSEMIASMQPSPRYGNGVTKLYAASGLVYHKDSRRPSIEDFPNGDPSKRMFTIDFYDDRTGSFAGNFVNDTGIGHKGAELAAVVKEVTRIAGTKRAIVIAHSLGGLATRTYIEGIGTWDTGGLERYNDDVAKVVTIDTPHKGTLWATQYLPATCIAEPSVDKTQMQPDSGFLQGLNYGPSLIPSTTAFVSVVSWDATNPAAVGDLVVSYAQQKLKDIPPYPDVDSVSDVENKIKHALYAPPLHTVVHRLAKRLRSSRTR
jgi:pimeloyl-ACP methyl ester carboxylesterase